jgi:hypothetical protein
MIKIILWFLIIGGPIAGFYLIFNGIKENKRERIPFKFKDLFFRTAEYDKSGTVKIIEGVGTVLASTYLAYAYIF